ncbi:hypothetical protein D3C71_1568340 [compost metagenome]
MTHCPAIAWLMCISPAIWSSRPAGRVSLRMAMKPVMARASRPLSGRRSAAATAAAVTSGEEVCDIAGCLQVAIKAVSLPVCGIRDKDG